MAEHRSHARDIDGLNHHESSDPVVFRTRPIEPRRYGNYGLALACHIRRLAMWIFGNCDDAAEELGPSASGRAVECSNAHTSCG